MGLLLLLLLLVVLLLLLLEEDLPSHLESLIEINTNKELNKCPIERLEEEMLKAPREHFDAYYQSRCIPLQQYPLGLVDNKQTLQTIF